MSRQNTQSGPLTFEIEYTAAADRFLAKHEDVRGEFEDAVSAMMSGRNREADVKKIKGSRGDFYRIRTGSYRVVYTIINGKIVVIKIIAAENRDDVYKKYEDLLKQMSRKREPKAE